MNPRLVSKSIAVTVPGFSRWGLQPQRRAPTYYFSRKVHENERNLTEGGRMSVAPPLDPPMNYYFWLIETDLIHREKLNVFTDWKFVLKFAQKFYFMQIRNKNKGNLRGEFNKSTSTTSHFYT